jgi:hypothetical protein
MNAQLAEISGNLRLNAERARKLVSRAGEARISERPRAGSWSAAECLVHLTLATQVNLSKWRTAFAEARARGLLEQGPFRTDLAGSMFIRILEPPPGIRVKAHASLQPASAGGALPGFLASQEKLLEIVSDANGLALDRIKVESPLVFRVNVWSSFRMMEAHQRRHLLQAERAAGMSE